MSTTINGAAARPKSAGPQKREVKLLMIHGFTQNGPLFRTKTRALERALAKLLAPLALVPQLLYPTGPIRLRPSDMPFYEPPPPGGAGGSEQDFEPETYAWWRRNDASGRYVGIGKGMTTLAAAIRGAGGGLDGVIGFSQGGCAASLAAAAMESHRPLPSRPEKGDDDNDDDDDGDGDDSEAWARVLREANGGRPLKLCVVYSGFKALDPDLAWLLEPKVATPTLHVLGSLDTAVDESRSQALIDACEDPQVVTHPGGHHVPVAKEWVMPLAGFIKKHIYDKEVKAEL